MGALFDMLDATAPATTRPRTVTLRKRTAADATMADVRFRVMSQLNDGTPIYWYGRRQNGGSVPSYGGVRLYGAYLERGSADVTAADFLGGGTSELVLTVKPAVGGTMTQVGTAHGHEGDWILAPVFHVDGVQIDYGAAAIDSIWTGEVITCTFTYPVRFGDDSANVANITRTMRFSRDGLEIRQTRILVADAYIGDAEYHGMLTCQNGTHAAPMVSFDACAIDTVTGMDGEAMGAGGSFEYPRIGGFAFHGNGYVAAVQQAGEVPAARLSQGVAGYLNDRSGVDEDLKAYHLVTDGGTAGTLYSAGDTVTTVSRWQVWAETPELVANLAAWAAGTYAQKVSTAAAIRNRMVTTVLALAPTTHSQIRYRFPADDDGDFRAWAEATPAAALRRFVVQEIGPIRPPVVSDTVREWVDEQFELVVAYPIADRGRFGTRPAARRA
jgi:hypothetical protein